MSQQYKPRLPLLMWSRVHDRILGLLARSVILITLCLTAFSANANAQTAVEQLSECLIMQSTGADRVVFVRWTVLGLASHPAIARDVNMRPQALDEASKSLAALVIDLTSRRCRSETKAVIKETNVVKAFEIAFSAFGNRATLDMFNDSNVKEALEKYLHYIDKDKDKYFKALEE